MRLWLARHTYWSSSRLESLAYVNSAGQLVAGQTSGIVFATSELKSAKRERGEGTQVKLA